MIRLFIALEIPLAIRKQIVSLRSEIAAGARARWEPIEKIHLTLKFLGDVDEKQIEQINSSLEFLSDIRTFKIRLTSFGLFRKGKSPAILWLGMEASHKLLSIYTDIENHMSELGFKKEHRPFHPHLTILRVKPDDDPEMLRSFEEAAPMNVDFHAEKFALIRSTLLPKGSMYENMREYNLLKNEI